MDGWMDGGEGMNRKINRSLDESVGGRMGEVVDRCLDKGMWRDG